MSSALFEDKEMSETELTSVVNNGMHVGFCDNLENGNGDEAPPSEPSHKIIEYCIWNSSTRKFLQATANYWPTDDTLCSLDKIYYGLTRLVNIGNIFVSIFNVCTTLLARNYPSEIERYVSAGIAFAVIIRTASVLVVQYLNQCRMQKQAHSHDTMVLEESTKIARIYGLIVLASNIFTTVLFIFSASENAGFYVTEYFLGTYLSFNLFFLVLDVKASSVLLDQLHLLADSQSLAMDSFVASRADIHRRVKESRWASDLIVVPCLASVVGILVLVIYFLDTPAQSTLKIEAAAFVCMFLKELLFVVIAFWYVAKLNARADDLTVKLSRSMWGAGEPILMVGSNDGSIALGRNGNLLSDRKSHLQSIPDNLAGEVVHSRDMHRLSIHASSISEPISFTLLFKRVSLKNVAISAGGFILAIFIAVVKNAAEQTLTT